MKTSLSSQKATLLSATFSIQVKHTWPQQNRRRKTDEMFTQNQGVWLTSNRSLCGPSEWRRTRWELTLEGCACPRVGGRTEDRCDCRWRLKPLMWFSSMAGAREKLLLLFLGCLWGLEGTKAVVRGVVAGTCVTLWFAILLDASGALSLLLLPVRCWNSAESLLRGLFPSSSLVATEFSWERWMQKRKEMSAPYSPSLN